MITTVVRIFSRNLVFYSLNFIPLLVLILNIFMIFIRIFQHIIVFLLLILLALFIA
jgi:hypothetical protein